MSGAALRAMRTAAGRRALQVALLVGGVFVFGLLCGERAQAADGAPVEESSSVSVTRSAPSAGGTPSTDRSAPPESNDPEPAGDVPAPPRPDAAHPMRPLPATATATAIRSVGERAVRPVGELVGAVTGGPGETPGNLPGLPALPGLAHPAPLPELPGLPTVPGNPLPEPNTPDPHPGTPTSPGTTAPVPDGPKGPERPADTAGPGHVAHGPGLTGTAGATHGGHGHGTARDAVHAEPAPAPHGPSGQSDGTPGQRPAADNGTPRHGDAYAVTAPHRLPLRLVPGAVARAEATGTRDRYRDVPVSPA